MSTPSMHLEAASASERTCDHCGSLFKAKRGWSRFCNSGCRNAFHTQEARTEAIRRAAPRMFDALRKIAAGDPAPVATALAALGDLKAP